MAKLQKLNVANIYDTISQNAPSVPATTETVSDSKTKSSVTTRDNSVASLLNPEIEERKTDAIYIRVKPSIRQKFDAFCKSKGVSQADMFQFWVESILK